MQFFSTIHKNEKCLTLFFNNFKQWKNKNKIEPFFQNRKKECAFCFIQYVKWFLSFKKYDETGLRGSELQPQLAQDVGTIKSLLKYNTQFFPRTHFNATDA